MFLTLTTCTTRLTTSLISKLTNQDWNEAAGATPEARNAGPCGEKPPAVEGRKQEEEKVEKEEEEKKEEEKKKEEEEEEGEKEIGRYSTNMLDLQDLREGN